MIWVAPSEKDTATATLEKRLWAAADLFRANCGLKAATTARRAQVETASCRLPLVHREK